MVIVVTTAPDGRGMEEEGAAVICRLIRAAREREAVLSNKAIRMLRIEQEEEAERRLGQSYNPLRMKAEAVDRGAFSEEWSAWRLGGVIRPAWFGTAPWLSCVFFPSLKRDLLVRSLDHIDSTQSIDDTRLEKCIYSISETLPSLVVFHIASVFNVIGIAKGINGIVEFILTTPLNLPMSDHKAIYTDAKG